MASATPYLRLSEKFAYAKAEVLFVSDLGRINLADIIDTVSRHDNVDMIRCCVVLLRMS